MKKMAMCLGFVLLLASYADAQITANVKAAMWTVELSAPGADSWAVTPTADLKTSGDKAFLTAPAGVYKVEAESKKTGAGWILRVTLGDGVPVPVPVPPTPTPVPVPVPVPVVQQVWSVIVEETATRPADKGIIDIITGVKLEEFYKAQKWLGPDGLPSLVVADKDAKFGNMDAGKMDWIKKSIAAAVASGNKLPVLVWCGETGGNVTVEPLQKNEDEQIKRLKEIGGVK